jgi:hypothetical protein
MATRESLHHCTVSDRTWLVYGLTALTSEQVTLGPAFAPRLVPVDAPLEVPVELDDAITDGFQLVRLPRVGQQELLAMVTSGTGREVEASPSPAQFEEVM